ncbi:MAG: 5-(carboxyamino)imidazole ribonucleotide mutase [Actinobacteria bacterium]|nr:5-(carboxyamino)imidazole ribonucleotide mutase [Actinomycetota bacterium]MBU1943364.1 5-(carboxyamino)imidazole ribonucleotide mutase [Actinomycetota bacterium]MBU2686518.1 5-(carboxyamino)imidazole ribonucleotide mutase [Actinomycetota bacterium]
MGEARVLVITGSESDRPRMTESVEMLDRLGIASELVVASAHRTPEKVEQAVEEAVRAGAEVIIAGAGMSAALPGVVAAYTDLPVIGVPLDSGMPGGIDALFSIVQMPTGIPVACVAVGGSKNAAVLAARILAIKYDDVRERLAEYRKGLREGSR